MSNDDDFSAPRDPNFLKKQLERSRFDRAIEVVIDLISKNAFLNSAELARINNILRGETIEPWRSGAAVCALPGGAVENFQMLADPVNKAREILTKAKDKALAGEPVDAACELYADLVMTHVFKDANRRTAVVAAAYLLKLHGFDIAPAGLHELGLGNLRDSSQKKALQDLMKSLVKIKK